MEKKESDFYFFIFVSRACDGDIRKLMRLSYSILCVVGKGVGKGGNICFPQCWMSDIHAIYLTLDFRRNLGSEFFSRSIGSIP